MIRVALYGSNGHQIHDLLVGHPRGQLVAVAGLSEAHLAVAHRAAGAALRVYPNLRELLTDEETQLVSLCSPVRGDQAAEAIQCLEAGKHVYAEKPCALNEPELDAILAAAQKAGREFHEMAGTVFLQPYWAMRQVIQAGTIGEVVQVVAQKCYPYRKGTEERPQDERIDGGLLRQAGVHAVRMVEQLSLKKVTSVSGWETPLGNTNPAASGDLRVAATITMELEGGGLAVATANYLNPPGTGIWGYEAVTVYGTKGLVESQREGQITRLVVGAEDRGPLDLSEKAESGVGGGERGGGGEGGRDYFEYFLDVLEGTGAMPLTLEEELHPTRIVLRAKADAERRGLLHRNH